MSQKIKPIYLAAITLFLLQLGHSKSIENDAVKANENYEAPFVTSFKGAYNSHTANKLREATGIIKDGAVNILKQVEQEINESSRNPPHSIIPNFAKYDILDPASATVKVISRNVYKPFDNYVTDVHEKYTSELKKANGDKNASTLKRKVNVPLTFLSAAKTVTGEKVGYVKDKTVGFWNNGKRDNSVPLKNDKNDPTLKSEESASVDFLSAEKTVTGEKFGDVKDKTTEFRNNERPDNNVPLKTNENYEAPFVTSFKGAYNSHTANKLREATGILKDGAVDILKQVEHEINESSRNREHAPHSIIPNFAKYDILDPASATVKVISRNVYKPLDNYATDVHEKYTSELKKANGDKNASTLKRKVNVPLTFLSAAKTVTGEKVGYVRDKTVGFWNNGKPNNNVPLKK